MEDRNYNPLNEGYSGLSVGNEGYKGRGYTGTSGTTSQAPQTFPSIQSAVVKTSTTNTSSNTKQKQD